VTFVSQFSEENAMKQKTLLLFVLTLGISAIYVTAYAEESGKDKPGPYKLLTTITLPGGLTGFDISWVDSSSGRYYLADRGNATATPPVPPRIDVIDTESDAFLYSITGFAGANGVLSIRRPDVPDREGGNQELWVGDNDSTAKVVDLKTRAIVATIPTGGTGRADELAYDPVNHVILIANDRDTPPFVTFIDAKKRSVLGTISYPQAIFGTPATNHGIEQPVWDSRTKHFYISIPGTARNAKGEVDEIDPTTRSVTRVFPTTCAPAGLALIPGQHLITSCGDVLDVAKGTVIHTVTGVSGDEIWFNRGDERVYFGGGTDRISVNVVDAKNYNVVTSLTVGAILTPSTLSQTTHSVAADSENNHIFVPVSHVGIKVYTDKTDDDTERDH
jgi:hypothetical protein